MTLVKAETSFYHDAVGTKASGEVFDIKNETVVSELESAGYVCKLDGNEAQTYQERADREAQYGQAQAKANENVSIANHQHHQDTLSQQAKVDQLRQQSQTYQTEMAKESTAQQTTNQQAMNAQRATAKKADK